MVEILFVSYLYIIIIVIIVIIGSQTVKKMA